MLHSADYSPYLHLRSQSICYRVLSTGATFTWGASRYAAKCWVQALPSLEEPVDMLLSAEYSPYLHLRSQSICCIVLSTGPTFTWGASRYAAECWVESLPSLEEPVDMLQSAEYSPYLYLRSQSMCCRVLSTGPTFTWGASRCAAECWVQAYLQLLQMYTCLKFQNFFFFNVYVFKINLTNTFRKMMDIFISARSKQLLDQT